jgi:hypothetical protein
LFTLTNPTSFLQKYFVKLRRPNFIILADFILSLKIWMFLYILHHAQKFYELFLSRCSPALSPTFIECSGLSDPADLFPLLHRWRDVDWGSVLERLSNAEEQPHH